MIYYKHTSIETSTHDCTGSNCVEEDNKNNIASFKAEEDLPYVKEGCEENYDKKEKKINYEIKNEFPEPCSDNILEKTDKSYSYFLLYEIGIQSEFGSIAEDKFNTLFSIFNNNEEILREIKELKALIQESISTHELIEILDKEKTLHKEKRLFFDLIKINNFEKKDDKMVGLLNSIINYVKSSKLLQACEALRNHKSLSYIRELILSKVNFGKKMISLYKLIEDNYSNENAI